MFENIIFIASALLVLAGSAGVVFAQNLMHACVYLLGSLFGVAGLYLTLGADFLAAAQLVVYAGGVVILMLFAVMLTGGNQGKSDNRFGLTKIPGMGNAKTYTFAAFSAIVISLILLRIMSRVLNWYKEGELPPLESTVEEIGITLVTDHVVAFELSSVLLLGALIGAAVIARPKKGQ